MRAMAGAALALGLLATACRGGGDPPLNDRTGTARVRRPATAAEVGRRKTSLGTTLVDGAGRTLYLFEGDAPGRSACDGSCVQAFPPLLTAGRAHARHGVRMSLLGTAARPDGTTQVTYRGRPLYLFAGDMVPGDVRAQGVDAFGAEWFAVTGDSPR